MPAVLSTKLPKPTVRTRTTWNNSKFALLLVEAHIKNLVLDAVPSTFIEELDGTLMGFARVSTIQILTHLRTTAEAQPKI
jgi:hypothetical protein